MASKFIKTRSNYVYRDQHQKTSGGTVFERDFMTISPFDAMSPSEEQIYGTNNFKFQVRSGLNEQKKHNNGRWIPDTEVGAGEETIKKKAVKINPDYESIKDFAYYGSAVNLVKASVVEVILNFPAELYFTGNKFPGKVTFPASCTACSAASNYYLVSNDYGIDVATENFDEEKVDNELRYLAKSLDDYIVYEAITTANTSVALHETCPLSMEVTHYVATCEEVANGVIIASTRISLSSDPSNPRIVTIYTYQKQDEITLLYSNLAYKGYSIRPKNEIVEDFFDNASDFVRVLLNRDTNPLYTATFNTPQETDKGFISYKQDYIWPCANGWNPDISNLAYEKYLEKLITLASFHDEYETDNIWRSMTHEAIKNLDWTFTRERGDETTTFETVDSTKIEPILKVYGRQYDDLKRYTDVISKSGNVTYNKKNNVPDNVLGNTLTNAGWEICAVNTNVYNLSVPYDSGKIVYDKDEVNNEFYRRLRVNSPYILSLKGTRAGVITMLGLFGLKENEDFSINEYIAIAGAAPVAGSTASTYPSYDVVSRYNQRKYTYDMASGDYLYGLPLRKVFYKINEDDFSYVVPWFNKTKKYDNGLYFQMNGGWSKTDRMKVNNTDLSQYKQYIESSPDFQIFEDTISNLKYAETLDDMLELGKSIVRTGDVCYVTDISGLIERYNSNGDTAFTVDNASHYFYLEDEDFFGTLGYVPEEDEEETSTTIGWKCILWSDLTAATLSKEAKMVYYLESIIDNTKGNNPHMGHNQYDAGQEYMDTMLHPFKPALTDGDFESLSDSELAEVTSCCFTFSTDADGRIDSVVDNQKCWYFTDRMKDMSENPDVLYDFKIREINLSALTNYKYDCGEIPTAQTIENTGVTITAITPYNPEDPTKNNDLAAADSIINSKRLSITFYEPIGHYRTTAAERAIDKAQYTNFILDKVLFYVKQVIPATTLFEYHFTECAAPGELHEFWVDSYFEPITDSGGSETTVWEDNGYPDLYSYIHEAVLTSSTLCGANHYVPTTTKMLYNGVEYDVWRADNADAASVRYGLMPSVSLCEMRARSLEDNINSRWCPFVAILNEDMVLWDPDEYGGHDDLCRVLVRAR